MKKGKSLKPIIAPGSKYVKEGFIYDSQDSDSDTTPITPTTPGQVQRSDLGVWIGNLPWTVTKAQLRKFLVEKSEITELQILRINVPPPAAAGATGRVKPQNKGFAYVDLTTREAVEQVLGLNESLMGGRSLLIKEAGSFEGRPEKKASEKDDTAGGGDGESKKPNAKVFVGNLGFETRVEDLKEHFEKCGTIKDVFMATFEDTGKCKGYAWVTFKRLEAAEGAVQGWVRIVDPLARNDDNGQKNGGEIKTKDGDGDGDMVVQRGTGKEDKGEKGQTKEKMRKWWVNRFMGRSLRVEFAEDNTVRYIKRYRGKPEVGTRDRRGHIIVDDGPGNDIANADVDVDVGAAKNEGHTTMRAEGHSVGNASRSTGPPGAGRKVDARTIKPGAALADAARMTGAIVESKGTKTSFS